MHSLTYLEGKGAAHTSAPSREDFLEQLMLIYFAACADLCGNGRK